MGYDHFALISVAEEPNMEEFNSIVACCGQGYLDPELLFGKVHHLTSGTYSHYWWSLFDEFMLRLYKHSLVEKFYLYVCQYDGAFLYRYEYIKGEKGNRKEIIMTINDPEIKCHWNIDTLLLDKNITSFYNKDYDYGYRNV